MDSTYIVLTVMAAMVGPGLVLAFLVWMFIRIQRKHPMEEGKTPRYTHNGSGVIGWLRYRGPLIRTSIYDDFMIVRCADAYYLPFTEIESVEKKKMLFITMHQINHRNPNYPKKIQLLWNNAEQAEELLRTKMKAS